MAQAAIEKAELSGPINMIDPLRLPSMFRGRSRAAGNDPSGIFVPDRFWDVRLPSAKA